MNLSQEQATKRHIPASDFKPCAEAFVDRRNPNSEGKLNYTFIGPGVAQSDTQVVNLSEAHGFNVGGVSLPKDRLNNLHLHFTAEVFISTKGTWEFIWGNEGEGSINCDPKDVFTIPTWIFRGFLNRSDDDSFMFAVIGNDQPGGIIWNPKVIQDAKDAGLRLSASSKVIDEEKGEKLLAGEDYIKEMSPEEMAKLTVFSKEDVEGRIIRWSNLDFRSDALPGGGVLAPILGHGMTASRHHYPQVANPHSFSLEWLKLAPGDRTGVFTSDKSFVAFVFEGNPQIVLNQDEHVSIDLAERSIYSVPIGTWREFNNSGSSEAIIMIAHGGDERIRPSWDQATIAKAKENGLAFDPDGYLVPAKALEAI